MDWLVSDWRKTDLTYYAIYVVSRFVWQCQSLIAPCFRAAAWRGWPARWGEGNPRWIINANSWHWTPAPPP